MSHEAAKQEHLKETIQDRSPREESVSRQPTNQLLLLEGRRKKILQGYADDRVSSEEQVADEKVGRGWVMRWESQERRNGWGRVTEETTTFTTSCKQTAAAVWSGRIRDDRDEGSVATRLITEPCVGIITHQAVAGGSHLV